MLDSIVMQTNSCRFLISKNTHTHTHTQIINSCNYFYTCDTITCWRTFRTSEHKVLFVLYNKIAYECICYAYISMPLLRVSQDALTKVIVHRHAIYLGNCAARQYSSRNPTFYFHSCNCYSTLYIITEQLELTHHILVISDKQTIRKLLKKTYLRTRTYRYVCTFNFDMSRLAFDRDTVCQLLYLLHTCAHARHCAISIGCSRKITPVNKKISCDWKISNSRLRVQ